MVAQSKGTSTRKSHSTILLTSFSRALFKLVPWKCCHTNHSVTVLSLTLRGPTLQWPRQDSGPHTRGQNGRSWSSVRNSSLPTLCRLQQSHKVQHLSWSQALSLVKLSFSRKRTCLCWGGKPGSGAPPDRPSSMRNGGQLSLRGCGTGSWTCTLEGLALVWGLLCGAGGMQQPLRQNPNRTRLPHP